MPDWTKPIRVGEKVTPEHPMASSQRGNLLTRLARRELGIGPPSDGKRTPRGGGGGDVTISEGLVVAMQAAVHRENSLRVTADAGWVDVLPWGSVPAFAAVDYDAGAVVRLSAAEHDPASSYATGDRVAEGGDIHQADSAISPGAFSGQAWTEIAEAEQAFEAIDAITAGPFDVTEWVEADGEQVIDKSATPTRIVHYLPFELAAWSSVSWLGDKLLSFEGAITSCPTLEQSGSGGLHLRIVCGTSTSPWVSLQTQTCDEGPETDPVFTP